jgi:hypothetical protein
VTVTFCLAHSSPGVPGLPLQDVAQVCKQGICGGFRGAEPDVAIWPDQVSRSFGIARCVRRGETAIGIAEHWARGVREAGGRCHNHMGAQVVSQLLVYLFGQLTLGFSHLRVAGPEQQRVAGVTQ